MIYNNNNITFISTDDAAAMPPGRPSDQLARETLLHSELCAQLGDRELALLLEIAQTRAFQADERLLVQGAEANAVYLPLSGHLLVERSAGNGQRQVLAFLQRGDYLGFSTSHRFVYSAQALTACEALRFPSSQFYAVAERIPQLKDNIGRIGNQVLARVLDHLFAIGQKRAHARLAFLLWQLWQRSPNEQQAEGRLILPMRRIDIADYLGLTLETTSRAFSRLRRDGLIATDHSQIVELRDIAALRDLAEVGN